jgi:SAM-dependent methyltransferase
MAQIELIENLKKQRKLFNLMKSAWYPLIDLKWRVERTLVSSCPVCRAQKPFDRVTGYGRTFLKCPACTHIWAHDYSRMRALIGMGMNDFGGGEADTGGDTEMFLARFCKEKFGSQSILLFGTGPTRAFRVLHGEGYDVFGTDVSADVIKFRQAEFGKERFFHPDQLGDMKFDVIISTEVIEHLFHPVAEMKGIVDHLTPGGIFCGSTGFSQDGGVDEGPNRYMAPRGHVIYWSENSLQAAFRRLGLSLTSFALGSTFASARIFFGTRSAAITSTLAGLKSEVGEDALTN